MCPGRFMTRWLMLSRVLFSPGAVLLAACGGDDSEELSQTVAGMGAGGATLLGLTTWRKTP
jgi:hypothetical protein